MSERPDATMQFSDVQPLDERDLKMLLDRIVTLQEAVIQIQRVVFEMQQRELNGDSTWQRQRGQ